MCWALKVANQRVKKKGEETEVIDEQQPWSFSGLNREREISAMVSALTQVVKGDVPDILTDHGDNISSNSSSPSSSGGQKRGREISGGDFSGSVAKLSRDFDRFPYGGGLGVGGGAGGSSSSGVIGN